MKNLKLSKWLAIGLFSFLIQPTAFSQNFKLNLSAGLNFSQVNGDKLAGFNKIGLHAGAGISRYLKNNQSIGFELIYSEKGSKDVVSNADPIVDTLFKFNYIEIPIIYQYQLKPKLNLQLGAYTAVNIKAVYNDGLEDYDVSNQIYNLDYGLLAGLSYELGPKSKFQSRVSTSIIDFNNTFEMYYNLVISMGICYSL